MRNSILTALKVCSVLALTSVGSVSSYSVQEAQAASCRGGQGIGVHRTTNLNTSGGKRYGKSHGGAQDFLKHKEVVLTFDDGPLGSVTNKVLHELDRHCTKATFFMVATMAKNNPSLARKVANKGHTVGIHSYSHKNLGKLNAKSAISDVNRSIAAIEKAVGRDVAPFFRFPYLSENRSVNQHLNRLGYGVFAIDVDSLDYRFSNSTSMVNRVMSELDRKGKGIILLHDIQKVTGNGIGQLLDRLNKGGYKIVHIRGRGGKDPSAPVLVSSAEPKVTKPKPIVVAANATAKPKEAWELRKSVSKKPKTKVKKRKVVKKKKITTKQALKDRKNPIRAKVKKRIVIAQAQPAKKKRVKTKKVASGTVQNTFKRNQAKALKQFEKNKQAFRAAIKKRIVN